MATTPSVPPSAALLLLADGRFPAGGHVHSSGVESAIGDGRVATVADLRSFLVGRLHTSGLSDAALAAATATRLASGDVCAPDRGHMSPAAGADQGLLLVEVVRLLDAEAAARLPVPPLRAASRRLGRQLVRVARRCWDHPVLDAVVAASGPERTDRSADISRLGAGVPAMGGDAADPSGPCVTAGAGGSVGGSSTRARGRRDRVAGAGGGVGTDDGIHHPVALGAVAVGAGLSADDAAALAVHHVLSIPAQAAVRLLGLDPFAVVSLLAELVPVAEQVADRAIAAAEGPIEDLPAGAGPLVEIAALDHEHWPIRMFAT
jgi:urease accessory protein